MYTHIQYLMSICPESLFFAVSTFFFGPLIGVEEKKIEDYVGRQGLIADCLVVS